MSVTIKLFAVYREMLERAEIVIEHPNGRTVSELFLDVTKSYIAPEMLGSTLFAINETYVSGDAVVQDGDRVAFLPPLSGG